MTSKQILSEIKKQGYSIDYSDPTSIGISKSWIDDSIIDLAWNFEESNSCCGVMEIKDIDFYREGKSDDNLEALMLAYMLSRSFEEENKGVRGKSHKPFIVYSNNKGACKQMSSAVVDYATEYVQLFESINPNSKNVITAYARYNNPYKAVKIATPKKTKQKYVRS